MVRRIYRVHYPNSDVKQYRKKLLSRRCRVKDGFVMLDGKSYTENIRRAEFGTRKVFFLFQRDVIFQDFIYDNSDPLPQPFEEIAPSISAELMATYVKAKRVKRMMANEVNLWAFVALIAVFGLIVLGYLLYRTGHP